VDFVEVGIGNARNEKAEVMIGPSVEVVRTINNLLRYQLFQPHHCSSALKNTLPLLHADHHQVERD
jgi:hypothetical protein